MANDLNSVKSKSAVKKPRRSTYHHGDLREALIKAAQDILGERGVAGFSLREAARRVGVSAAAPAHHFGDTRGLLTAVAARGFQGMAAQLESASKDASDSERLQAVGAAYLQFAQENCAIFGIMWTRDLLDQGDPAYLSAGRAAFNLLERAATNSDVPVATEPRLPAAPVIAAWAMVHGLARLTLDGALDRIPSELQSHVLKLMSCVSR